MTSTTVLMYRGKLRKAHIERSKSPPPTVSMANLFQDHWRNIEDFFSDKRVRSSWLASGLHFTVSEGLSYYMLRFAKCKVLQILCIACDQCQAWQWEVMYFVDMSPFRSEILLLDHIPKVLRLET